MTNHAVVTSRSPQHPADVVAEAPATTPTEVQQRMSAARASAEAWRQVPAAQRAAALDAAASRIAADAEGLTALIVREVGKPLSEAAGEVSRAVAILRYFAQQAYDPIGELHAPSSSGLLFTERRPHGVAALITPWNFPLAIPLWKAAPALAFGNGVALKPAPEGTAVALRLESILGDVLPGGLCQVLPGDATTGEAVVQSGDCVSFTGSVAVGRRVAAAAVARGVPVQAEMGGQNAAIVLPDADPETAARQIVIGVFGYAGQKCTSTRRVIIVGGANEFADAFVEAARSLVLGDPADSGTEVGPVIDAAARDSVLAALDEARAGGGRLLAGRRDVDGDGWYVAPAVIVGLAPDHRLCQEEVFGPVCTMHVVGDDHAALKLSNGVRYGLVTGIYTRDLDRALRLVHGADTGLVKVNQPTSGVDFYLPFGGTKDSSYGPREQGKAARDFYTCSRTVSLSPAVDWSGERSAHG